MAAMNGILMFGWSTAVLFEVLLKAIEHLVLHSPLREEGLWTDIYVETESAQEGVGGGRR